MSLSISSDICAEDATLGDKMQHALQHSFKTCTETQKRADVALRHKLVILAKRTLD